MNKLVIASLAGTGFAGGNLVLTWEDCGDASTHGHVDDVQPTDIVIGQDNALTATGSTDKTISSGSFIMKLSGSLGIQETYNGNVCDAAEFNMPLGLGTISWAGMACPVAAGPATVGLGVKLASALPDTLATADLDLTAVDQDGEPALCVNNHLNRAAQEVPVQVASGNLVLTWDDCGDASTHGHVDDVQPTDIVIGQDNAITATGSTDKTISSGSFTMKLSGSLGIQETYNGNVCDAAEFNMPLGLGTISWAGMACPVAAGPATVGLGVKLASALPDTLATADLDLTAVDQDGEPALCVNNHLNRAAQEVPVQVASGNLVLTWDDCGDASTHGHVDDVQPTDIVIGQDNALTATGSTDKTISSGSFTMKLSGSLGIQETYNGNVCDAAEFNMPLGLGTISWAGMACPVAAGPATVGLGVKLASALPDTLATADLDLTAVDQDGEPALCVNNHLNRAVTIV